MQYKLRLTLHKSVYCRFRYAVCMHFVQCYDLHSSWTPWSVFQDGSNSCICLKQQKCHEDKLFSVACEVVFYALTSQPARIERYSVRLYFADLYYLFLFVCLFIRLFWLLGDFTLFLTPVGACTHKKWSIRWSTSAKAKRTHYRARAWRVLFIVPLRYLFAIGFRCICKYCV